LIDSGQVKDFTDLKGLRLNGVVRGSLTDMYLHQFMELGNLTDADVDVQYMSLADSLPAMASNTLDGAVEIEPWATAAVAQNVGVAWKRRVDVFGPAQNTVIMFAPNMAANRQDVGKRFMEGYVKAIRDYMDALNTGKDMAAIVALLARNTNVKDPALYDRMQLPVFDLNGQMDQQNMQRTQQWFVDNKYVPIAVDLNKVIDTSYLDYALAQDGTR
jgi:NitT/TauT family transport system substrate-binding protein